MSVASALLAAFFFFAVFAELVSAKDFRLWGGETMKGAQKNFPYDDNIDGTFVVKPDCIVQSRAKRKLNKKVACV